MKRFSFILGASAICLALSLNISALAFNSQNPHSNLSLVNLSIEDENISFGIGIAQKEFHSVTSEDNVKIYSDSKMKTIVTNEGHSVFQVTTIYSEEVSPHLEYELDLPDGATVDYERHLFTGQKLGNLLILDNSGNIIGTVLTPHVKDNDGINLNASYSIEEGSITLNFEIDEFTEYPLVTEVIATAVSPRLSNEIFTYFTAPHVEWNRDGAGLHSLMLEGPTDMTLYNPVNTSWQVVKDYYDGVPAIWYNEESLYNQYVCHYQFARNKSSWNIEPWRHNMPYLELYFCELCNNDEGDPILAD